MHALFGTHKDAALPFFEQLLPDFHSLLVSEIFDWRLCSFSLYFAYSAYYPGLEITAGQRTMSGLIGELTGQPFVLPVMLTGHI